MVAPRYLILGAGGAGRTAAGIAERMLAGEGRDAAQEGAVAFLDDRLVGQVVNDHPVVGKVADALRWLCPPSGSGPACVVAFGTTFMGERRRLFEELRRAGATFFNAIDPSVAMDRSARVGAGNIIAAQCVMNPNAVLGDNCFLCVATTVDHDTALGHNVYCSPGVNLAGRVVVEDDVFLGTNAAVLPEIRVGRGAVVGAGAVVRKDVPPGATVVGNPARILRYGGKP